MELRGKVALVTGGAIRVGKVIALTLAERGAHVAITYNRSAGEADKTAAEIRRKGVRAAAVQTDISRSADVERMVATLLSEFGQIDVLVNNAAVFFRTPFATLTEKDWDTTIDTNLKGTFLCARAVGAQMLTQGRGKIINTADWAGIRPYNDYLPYCVSKAGVIALTQALAKALAPDVQVNCVAPGPVLLPEDFSEEEREKVIRATPLKRIGSPQDIANTILFLVEGTDFVTGATYLVDGGRLIG